MNASVLNIAFTLSSELFTEVGRMLILDILDNWIPASIVINLVTVAGCVNNVETESDTIFLDDYQRLGYVSYC
jgi:hypothetical protein